MDKSFHKLITDRKEVALRYDPRMEAIWVYSNPEKCPCLNVPLLSELRDIQREIIEYFKQHNMQPKTPVKFVVYVSKIPEVYSHGGDLESIVDIARYKNKDKLDACGKLAITDMYYNAVNFHLPLQTLTLIEGDAFGGGFEKALSFNALIAEEQSRFGFQQSRFGIFSGLGYEYLVRKAGLKNAEKIITSYDTYSAEQMKAFGVVERLAKRGEGEKAANEYMEEYRRTFHIRQALFAAEMRRNPLLMEDLNSLAELWASSILNMDKMNLRRLGKIVEGQRKIRSPIERRLRTKQDRRFEKDTITFPLVDAEGKIIEEDRRHIPDPRGKD